MPVWCLLNAGGRGYRALTAQCRPQQPIENVYSNRLSEKLARCTGVMFERDGNIGCIEHTDEEKRAPAELAFRLLKWARTNAVVIPAIPDKDMAPEVRR